MDVVPRTKSRDAAGTHSQHFCDHPPHESGGSALAAYL